MAFEFLMQGQTVKTKIIIAFVAIVGMLELTGCKPKTTTLNGQVFIVTRGADNVKFGDIEILLIDKSQVIFYLKKKNPIIDSEIASYRQALEVAKSDVEKAQADYNLFETNKPDRFGEGYDLFLANKIFDTYPGIEKIKLRIKNLRQQAGVLSKQADILQARRDQAEKQGDYLTSEALLVQDNFSGHALDLYAEADSELDKLQGFVNRVESEKEDILNTAKTRKIDAAKTLANSPTAEDYLTDFSPMVVQRVLSDADGRFSFVYLRNKSLTICANAQRSILNGTERYYWLIDAPTNAETVQVFLSNNNLVSVDPNAYFKLKPKQTENY